jgi:hypothetical protein
MSLHAGLDRSGTPDLMSVGRGHDPYTIALAAIDGTDENWRKLRDGFQEVRRDYGMSRDEEFRGHQTTDRIQAALLDAVIPIGVRIAALIIDKKATREQSTWPSLPAPIDFQVDVSLAFLEDVLPSFPLAWLWCDEDIKGRKQQEFTTHVKRTHRAIRPDERIKVKHVDSKSNELVQLADIVAYGLSGMARGETMAVELRRCLSAIRNDPMNIIIGPVAWESN